MENNKLFKMGKILTLVIVSLPISSLQLIFRGFAFTALAFGNILHHLSMIDTAAFMAYCMPLRQEYDSTVKSPKYALTVSVPPSAFVI